MDPIKIVFDLHTDDDGFPPIGAESLHAKADERGGFILDNTPFFVEGVAAGDRVEAVPMPGATGRYRFIRVLEPSPNKAMSIIFLSENTKETVFQELKRRGCYCEYGEFHKRGELEMLAVSVPETSDYESIRTYLSDLEENEELSFAELAVQR